MLNYFACAEEVCNEYFVLAARLLALNPADDAPWTSLKGTPWWETITPASADKADAHREGAHQLTAMQCQMLVEALPSCGVSTLELAEIMGMVRMNAVGICVGGGPDDPGDAALGLFDATCRINHSCEPNAAIVAVGDPFASATVCASRPIAAGEEVTIDYLACSEKAGAAKRAELLEQYRFECRCAACQRECG